MNPRGSRTVFFHNRKLGLGNTLIIRGDQPEPLTVQLQPCGSLVGRLVNKSGKPLPDLYVNPDGKDGCLFTLATTDRQGRFRVALVPGRKYWLQPLLRDGQAVEVNSGEVKDLGDLCVGN